MNEGIKIAIELQKQGVSLQKIVDKLNADGIPTVTGHGKWNKGTVSKQLKRYEMITDKQIQEVKEVLPNKDNDMTVKQKELENMTLQLQTYQHEIAERDAIIADLNMKLANSVPKNPNSFEGWTIVKSEKYVRIFKKFSGKTIGAYVGKEFDADIARRKIAEMTARLKTSVTLIPKRRGRKPKQTLNTYSHLMKNPDSDIAGRMEKAVLKACS